MAHLFVYLLCLSANTWHHKMGIFVLFSCGPGWLPGEICIHVHVPAKSQQCQVVSPLVHVSAMSQCHNTVAQGSFIMYAMSQ